MSMMKEFKEFALRGNVVDLVVCLPNEAVDAVVAGNDHSGIAGGQPLPVLGDLWRPQVVIHAQGKITRATDHRGQWREPGPP